MLDPRELLYKLHEFDFTLPEAGHYVSTPHGVAIVTAIIVHDVDEAWHLIEVELFRTGERLRYHEFDVRRFL